MSLPQFNKLMAMWRPGHLPSVDPADGSYEVQLYVISRPTVDVTQENIIMPPATTTWVPGVYVRLPLTLFGDYSDPYVGTIWGNEIGPVPFQAYWRVVWWEVMHFGFPNEYICMQCIQCDQFGASPDPRR